mmetsp:Transcript_55887/g.112020  ORF Transcript_55887/g.112020 Transcript_55887/m.112020 type:complete len:244 (-) Transcript_55887:216-947(-)
MSTNAMDLRSANKNGVFVCTFNGGENRFNPKFFEEINRVLDTVESHDGATALVLTGGSGKFFSNGFDIEWLMGADSSSDALTALHGLFRRLLLYPVPTVCAINGHAFAGGAMLALACDFRLMNRDKGFFCTNELAIGLPFTDGMMALFNAKVGRLATVPLLLAAERLPAERCVALGLVDAAVDGARLEQTAIALAAQQAAKGKNKALMALTKYQLFGAAASAIATSPPNAPDFSSFRALQSRL